MLNCFLTDKSLHNREVGTFDDAELSAGYGFVTEKIRSYYKTPASLRDIRTSRLDLGGFVSTYQLQFTLDDEFNTEAADLDALTNTETEQLFSIIEALAYRNDLDDTAMETLLTGSPATFGAYVATTFERSAATGTLDFYADGVVAAETVITYNWVSFDVTLGGEVTTFKLWISNSDFLAEYPHTYVVEIIYPGSPTELVDGGYASIVSAIADMSNYIIDLAKPSVDAGDNTGLLEFVSAYFPHNSTANDQVSIGVLYKGAMPSTAVARDAIRTNLLALNIVPQTTWEAVLPDLFVVGKFFLVPTWDHFHALPGLDLPKGIVSTDHIQDVLEAVYASKDPVWMKSVSEVLVSAGSEFYIIALPDNGNDAGQMSLEGEHPTYQPIDQTKPYFANQEPHTRDFNITLSAAMALLTGANNQSSFTEDQIDGRWYITFVANLIEYHVLKPSSYPGTI